MIIATAGHIDHGKTTLLRALTGIDTDRLPEEKERGISIDLGFAHWNTPSGGTIGFVDVPGHERFIRNMLCGVCAIDHVLLVIAADDGVMPQTREHLSIIDLLGVTQGTIAITKVDRVSPERIAKIADDARRLLEGTSLEGAAVIDVSAITGAGMDALRQRLNELAKTATAHEDANVQLPRFIIDRAFTVPGSGTVVTGTVIAGEFAQNDHVIVSPAGTDVRVRKLQQHGRPALRARSGQRCAINLAQIEHTAVGRGDWLIGLQPHIPTDRIDVRLNLLPASRVLKHGAAVHVHIGAAHIPARVFTRRGTSIAAGESALMQLRLNRPVNACHGDRVIIRDPSAMQTLGGCLVLDPFPSRRATASQRASTLAAMECKNPADSLAALIETRTQGVDLNWFARVFNRTKENVDILLPADAKIFGVEPSIAFGSARLDEIRCRILDGLKRFHSEQPGATWADSAPLKKDLAAGIDLPVFLALLKHFAAEGCVVQNGAKLRLKEHNASDNPREMLLWQKVRPLLEQAVAEIPSARELADRTGSPLPTLRDLLHRKSAAGQLVGITPERFALPQTLAMLAGKAREVAASSPDGLFTAAQYRDAIRTGRGLAIEILEHLDKIGSTRRKGGHRSCTEINPPTNGAVKERTDP